MLLAGFRVIGHKKPAKGGRDGVCLPGFYPAAPKPPAAPPEKNVPTFFATDIPT